jgi:rhamnose transport system ATP-binding protein
LAVAPLLSLSDIHKSFGGVRALRGVHLELLAGEVHAVVGENGAGKSTLIKIITGAHAPDEGKVLLAGEPIEANDPTTAKKLGIAAIYQQPALFADLTVAENIALGLEKPAAWRVVNWKQRRRIARELLDRVGANISPDVEVRRLSMPQQQLVEIARALGQNARILIMDEPTASLSDREVENLFRVIKELKRQGVGIIYISHRLEELPTIADRVTVLRDGAWIGTHAMAEVNRSDLIRTMVGREVAAIFPKVQVPLGETALELRNVSCRTAGVGDISFSVRSGEIFGLAGLVGAGRTELARVLFGLTPADEGDIFINGQRVVLNSPAAAIAHRIAYVPEDRRRHGVILEMPVAENETLAILRRITRLGLLDFSEERRVAEQFVQQLGVKTASLDSPVGELSGGNQQKVALGRWLATSPKVLILDEPTQGVDVGAKSEIHRIMGELAGRGLAIVMISSELPEILGMSDRIAVMHDGSITGILNRDQATQERILELALGHIPQGAS